MKWWRVKRESVIFFEADAVWINAVFQTKEKNITRQVQAAGVDPTFSQIVTQAWTFVIPP